MMLGGFDQGYCDGIQTIWHFFALSHTTSTTQLRRSARESRWRKSRMHARSFINTGNRCFSPTLLATRPNGEAAQSTREDIACIAERVFNKTKTQRTTFFRTFRNRILSTRSRRFRAGWRWRFRASSGIRSLRQCRRLLAFG